jgi:hypothetical protein
VTAVRARELLSMALPHAEFVYRRSAEAVRRGAADETPRTLTAIRAAAAEVVRVLSETDSSREVRPHVRTDPPA